MLFMSCAALQTDEDKRLKQTVRTALGNLFNGLKAIWIPIVEQCFLNNNVYELLQNQSLDVFVEINAKKCKNDHYARVTEEMIRKKEEIKLGIN